MAPMKLKKSINVPSVKVAVKRFPVIFSTDSVKFSDF